MAMISRRTLLVLAAGTAASATGLAVLSSLACSARTLVAAERLFVVLPQMPDAARIGESYRARHGLAGLERQLISSPALLEAASITCPEARRELLRAALRRDFTDGAVETVDGWVLCRSECVIAGLASALNS